MRAMFLFSVVFHLSNAFWWAGWTGHMPGNSVLGGTWIVISLTLAVRYANWLQDLCVGKGQR